MSHLSSRESSKPPSLQKESLMVELEKTKRSLVQREEDIWKMMERLQRLNESQDRQNRERRWEPRRTTRYQMHYGS